MSAPSEQPRNWKRPPVVELAISVQFAPIEGFTSAHVGLYWKALAGPGWDKVREAVALDDQTEEFGQAWTPQTLQFSAVEKLQYRTQISNAGEDRLIQVQNTRFIYNWRKREGDYPSFDSTLREFSDHLEGFRAFLRGVGLGEIEPNQWELTYVDYVPQGALWATPADFHAVLPGLFAKPSCPDTVALESTNAEQHFEILQKRGRVHMAGRHGRLPGGAEVITLSTTARGPVDPVRPGFDLDAGLRLGHDAISQTFWPSPPQGQ